MTPRAELIIYIAAAMFIADDCCGAVHMSNNPDNPFGVSTPADQINLDGDTYIAEQALARWGVVEVMVSQPVCIRAHFRPRSPPREGRGGTGRAQGPRRAAAWPNDREGRAGPQ
jgi:hypothetical protein